MILDLFDNMNNNLKKKVERLSRQIDDLRHRYHVDNDPTVTDKMYEGLMNELREIEFYNPELITPDSPTQRVAGEILTKFEKIKHPVPQWSFDDAFTLEDVERWQERNMKILEKNIGTRPRDISYSCELKIDGLHIILVYRSGKLVSAATRGDGKVGENVTQNIKVINSVPLILKKSIDIIVEGEVWMPSAMLHKINTERSSCGQPLYANPRNVAAGTIRQLDSKIVSSRKLEFTAYDISSDGMVLTQSDELVLLKSLGFKTESHSEVYRDIEEVVSFWRKWEDKKNSQPFWVDGIVIKINELQYQKLLGFTGKSPRWAIALKFSAEQGTTKIKDIYVQVGRTGILTPVAFMEPISLAGTTVTHATLHNFEEIKRLDVRVGDTVVVEKAGDIIPKVVRVLDKMRTGVEKKIKPIKNCPICHSKTERRKTNIGTGEISVGIYCTNKNCYAQKLRQLSHFVSKKSFNIDGLGKQTIEQLVDEGLIKNADDLFNLTVGDVSVLDGFGDKSADNLIRSIHSAKKITLAKFIFALGIPHVGEGTSIALAESVGSLNAFIQADLDSLLTIEDIGEKVADSIIKYLQDEDNMSLIRSLLKNDVIIENVQKNLLVGKLSGKVVVITGSLSNLSRDEAKARVRYLGGHTAETVSKKTDFVVVGDFPGSKFTKAKRLNIKILNEKEFLSL